VTSTRPLTIAVTGGAGYVGSALCRAVRNAGWRAISFQRHPRDPDSRPFVLGEPLAPDAFHGVDVLVHAAYDFRAYGWEMIRRVNVESATDLFRAGRVAGVGRSIFISSISAFKGCVSDYGRAKLELEQRAAEFGTVMVRPGLVWGGASGGMMGALRKLAGLPVVPLVGSGRQLQYLAHEDDLGQLIVRLARDATTPDVPVIAAHATPLTLSQIMMRLAGRPKPRLPIPWRLIWAVLKGLETMGLHSRFRSDSLVGLMNADPSPDFTATHALGLTWRPFGQVA